MPEEEKAQSESTAVAKSEPREVKPIKEVVGIVGDIKTMEVSDKELAPEYWSPAEEGESKRLIYLGVQQYNCPDFQTKEPTTIEAAYFVEQVAEGRYKVIVNGSKKLIGTFENAGIEYGTPVEIAFLGMKKNVSNSNNSANWSVRKLVAGGQDVE